MILRKDYVKLIKDGKAQVEVEKTEEHNDMLTLLFTERYKLKVTIHLMDTYYKFDNTAYNYSSSIVHPFENLPIINASDIILDNTVIKVESEEHGKRVIEWWKEQGVEGIFIGNIVGTYVGMYGNEFGFYDGYYAKLLNKKIITLPEPFPSKWYLKITNENKKVANEWSRSVAISHLNTYLDNTGYILLSKHEFDESFFLSKFTSPIEQLKYYSDYTEISTEYFLDHIYKPWKNKPIEGQILIKQENKMRTITWQEAQKLIDMVDISCKWKGKLLDLWAKSIVLKQPIVVSDELLQQGRKDASTIQEVIIDRIFGKEKEEIDLEKKTGIGGLKLFSKTGGINTSLIAIRSNGEYCNTSFYLNSNFNWEIKKDGTKVFCLIPTYK